jgi:hypothetical protein
VSRRVVWRASDPRPTRTPSALKGSGRLDRWLLNPLYPIPILFAVQAIMWYFGMPANPASLGDSTLATASPRFISEASLIHYLVILAALLFGLLLGQGLLPHRRRPREPGRPTQARVEALLWVARIAGVMALVGELFYARNVLANPAMLIGAAQEGAFGSIGMSAATQRIVGISSLSNLFLVSSSLCAIVALHPGVEARYIRSARRWLIGLTIGVLLHSLVLSARVFFIYHLAAVLAAHILVRPGGLRLRTLAIMLSCLVLLVWGGETLRGGSVYARRYHTGLFAAATQRSVCNRLVISYMASDFNNAMYILDSPPSMQFVSTTMFARVLSDPKPYPLPGSFCTVNSLALWWYDFGWAATLVAFLAGGWMSFAYSVAVRQARTLGRMVPLFVVTYPGLYAFTRVNYFAMTIFIAPTAYLVIVFLVIRLLRKLKAEGVGAR